MGKNEGELDDARGTVTEQLTTNLNNLEASVNEKEEALEAVKAARKDAFNPYAGLTNEFANLGVATQAAEFQAEETDIALANTLDAMQASGAGAGGATALAQAALKSKRGISSSIQKPLPKELLMLLNKKLKAKSTNLELKKKEIKQI